MDVMGLKPDVKLDYSELKKTWKGVFDELAVLSLYKLISRGMITEIKGVIKQGKESVVLAGLQKKKPIAIKVYAIKAANFKRMRPYLTGDPRFKKIKSDKRSVIHAWAKKEFKNLERARKAGVKCPKTVGILNNVLVMEFIGDDYVPAPRLTGSKISNPEKLYKKIFKYIRLLYKEAKLVHGDLSEFNILLWKEEPWLIDFSQSLIKEHPNADEFLKRDIRNFCRYFKKLGVECTWEEIYKEVIA